MANTVSQDLQDLYSDYYSDNSANKKRTLSAKDTVDHFHAVGVESLGKVLDVGAGNGSVISEIAQQELSSDITALEISKSGIERIKALNLPAIKNVKSFDGYTIPFADKTFDTAICIHVLEHVEHERQLLKEIGRVSKNVILEIPLEGGLRGKINYTYGHINYYTPLSFTALVETSGFEIISKKVVTSSLAYEQHLYGALKGRFRNTIRRMILKLFGFKAPDIMTYVLILHCRPITD